MKDESSSDDDDDEADDGKQEEEKDQDYVGNDRLYVILSMFQGLTLKNAKPGQFSGHTVESISRYEQFLLEKNDFQCHRIDRMTVAAYE